MMHAIKEKPQGAANTHGAIQYERLHCAAQQDFTANAIDHALHMAMSAMLTTRCLLVRGDLPASLIAAREASRAISAAMDSLSAWVR